ncbi:MAG: CsgG/HfaB family protein [Gemmatimonadota bacterium]|jgi:TolB-like protein
MRRLPLLLLVLTALVPGSLRAQTEDTRPGIAVFPFTNGGSYGTAKMDLDLLSVGIQQTLLTELKENSALRIIERSRMREVLAEQDLAASGRVDAETAAKVGKALGARYAITGVFIDLNGNFRMDGRIVDVETTEILKTAQVQDRFENLYTMLFDLAGKITDDVDLPPLPQQVREQRREREIPAEALALYARGLDLQDSGRKDQAVEIYRQITDRFPEMTEASEALRQLTSG